MVRGWQVGLLVGCELLHSACGTTTDDPPKSKEQPAAGGEAGAPAVDKNNDTEAAGQGGSPLGGDGGAAGNAGDGGAAGNAGDAGAGGAICDDACLANRPPLWIVYGAYDVYGVRSDQLGKVEPVNLIPALDSEEEVDELGNWSPDGSAVLVITVAPVINPHGWPDFLRSTAYLLRFVGGSPAAPLEIARGGTFGLNDFTWSSNGKTLLFLNGGRLYAVDPAATQSAPPTQISLEGPSVERSWFKGDDEVVYLTRQNTTTDAVLAIQQGSAWETKSITHDLGIGDASSYSDVVATSDLSQLYYPAANKAGLLSLWSVQTGENSAQHLVAGPFEDLAFRLSPDDQQYLLAATDAVSRKTNIFGGAIASLTDPPLITDNPWLTARASLGSVSGTWSNDSRHALAFESGKGGTHAVLYQVGEAKPWQPLPVTVAHSYAAPTWSPDSKKLAIVRPAEGAGTAPSLFTSAGNKQRDLASVSAASGLDLMQFSPSGDFFVYRAGNVPPEGQTFYYLDLRRGLGAAGESTAIQADYPFPDFASDGTRLVYINQDDCFFLDLAKGGAPTAVANSSAMYACSIQKLPQ